MDTLTSFYFVAFLGGGAFAVVSWFLGHHGGHAHAGHGHLFGGHGHGGGHGHATGHGQGHSHPGADHGGGSSLNRLLVPLGNLSALAALSCVGGGVGFLTRRMGAGALESLLWAGPSGLGAGWLIGGLIAWLQRSSRFLEPFAYEGTLANVLARIGVHGTGEVTYLREGARYALPAVSASERAIEPGTPVIVLEVEQGVARVVPVAEVVGTKESQS
jgi:hypothetical protein